MMIHGTTHYQTLPPLHAALFRQTRCNAISRVFDRVSSSGEAGSFTSRCVAMRLRRLARDDDRLNALTDPRKLLDNRCPRSFRYSRSELLATCFARARPTRRSRIIDDIRITYRGLSREIERNVMKTVNPRSSATFPDC